MTQLDPAERSAIVRDSLGVGIATGTYGISFGAVSVGAGLDVWQTCVLSLLMFTGASQFALVGVVAGGGTPLSAAGTALLLGTRNTLYGLKVAPMLGTPPVARHPPTVPSTEPRRWSRQRQQPEVVLPVVLRHKEVVR